MKSLIVLSISIILLNINSFGRQNPWNTFLLNKGGGFTYAKSQTNVQGYMTESYSFNYYNDVTEVGTESNVKHPDPIGNELLDFINTPSISQNLEFVSANDNTYSITFKNINTNSAVLNTEMVEIISNPFADSLVNFLNQEKVSNSSLVSNVTKQFPLEISKESITIEIPGQAPSGITFLSIGFISGKTWIHKLMIK